MPVCLCDLRRSLCVGLRRRGRSPQLSNAGSRWKKLAAVKSMLTSIMTPAEEVRKARPRPRATVSLGVVN